MECMNDVFVWGEPLKNALEQMQTALSFGGSYGALMADHHLGYSVPVGGVIAYEGKICVDGVGLDIACGNKAVRLDCDVKEVKKNISTIMDEVQKQIAFGVGRKNNEKIDHELFEDPLWGEIDWLGNMKKKAEDQLGTVGSGNHYVDIFVDEKDRVWVGVHFGSRGLGHGIATYFLEKGQSLSPDASAPVVLDCDSDLGEQYTKTMHLAGKYAYAGRDWVCQKVADILGGKIVEEVHNHHNFAWKEQHHGKDLWVVRKGATPAFPKQKGFVGGSMGDISVILEGIEHEESRTALYSTIHGAGRAMARKQAKGIVNRKTGAVIKEGLIKRKDMTEWVQSKNVELRGAGVDEAPQCYKRIEDVLKAHSNTIKVLHVLNPIGVCMASDKEFDPYKD